MFVCIDCILFFTALFVNLIFAIDPRTLHSTNGIYNQKSSEDFSNKIDIVHINERGYNGPTKFNSFRQDVYPRLPMKNNNSGKWKNQPYHNNNAFKILQTCHNCSVPKSVPIIRQKNGLEIRKESVNDGYSNDARIRRETKKSKVWNYGVKLIFTYFIKMFRV